MIDPNQAMAAIFRLRNFFRALKLSVFKIKIIILERPKHSLHIVFEKKLLPYVSTRILYALIADLFYKTV